MRRLLTFSCEGSIIAATLDGDEGNIGILFVTGGSQTRIGSHRMFERTSYLIAKQNFLCFRYDRRGVGDSEGEDRGWKEGKADLVAAVRAFRKECPKLHRIIGFGLCDGASALALYGSDAGIDELILVNPWFVESEPGAPAPAAIRKRYKTRLSTIMGWKDLLTGAVSYSRIFQGIFKILAPQENQLGDEIAAAFEIKKLPITLILARDDATAIAAENVWKSRRFTRIRTCANVIYIDTDSHTFARQGDDEALFNAVQTVLSKSGGG